GAALTAVSGARPTVLGLLRTFAATAAAAVVLTHLLPEALSGAGLWGALAFLVGLVAPVLLHSATERFARRNSELSRARLALEAGFIGLLVHHVGDGLGIGAYAALSGGVLAHLDVILALIAHTVPLVAVVTLAYRAEYGLAVALRRAAALALMSALGVLLSFSVPAAALAGAVAWIGALVSGVLLHVVTHDWLEDLPRTEGARVLDLLAAALGLSLVLLGSGEHGHDHEHGGGVHALFGLAVKAAEHSAPFVLVGLLLAFVFGDRVHTELGKLGHSLPVRFTRRVGFALGADGLLLGLGCFGVVWLLAAFLATTLVPIVAGAVAMLAVAIAGEEAAKQTAERLARVPEVPPDRLRRFDRSTSIWVMAVALAAVIADALPGGALLGSIGTPSELALSGGLGALLGTGGTSTIAVSALSQKGLSPGAALLGVALSSALGFGVLRQMWRQFGGRAALPALIWLVSLTAVIGIGVNKVAPIPSPLRLPEGVGRVCALVLLGLVLLRAERAGVRRWLAGWVSEGTGGHGHHHFGDGHDHAPERGHLHSSDKPNGNAATTRSPDASGPSAEA
ncbi:MAG TPA: hypothetical protein VEX18_17955, partial [Polyangiaceae bacterium]|nr:hypothetical protein [Polyangiaceae bacterium]